MTRQFRQAVFGFDDKFKENQDKIEIEEVEPEEESKTNIVKRYSKMSKEPDQKKVLKLKEHYISGTFTNWEPRKMHSLS